MAKEKKHSEKEVYQAEPIPVDEPKLIAKKDFEIHHNEYHLVIKKGDDLSKVPPLYFENLKIEGVL